MNNKQNTSLAPQRNIIDMMNEQTMLEGYEASLRGEYLDDCPYREGSVDRMLWLRGWRKQREEERT